MSDYMVARERLRDTYAEVEPLYRQHYDEMRERLTAAGIEVSDYNPQTDHYLLACDRGDLLHFVVRLNGAVVGYCNVYITTDMHNGDKIATEDAIYVEPAHRNGLGRKLVKHILAILKDAGCKRVLMAPVTDPRVGKVWRRMGFKPTAEIMTYNF